MFELFNELFYPLKVGSKIFTRINIMFSFHLILQSISNQSSNITIYFELPQALS